MLTRTLKGKNIEVVPTLEPAIKYKIILKDKVYNLSQIESLVRHFDDSIDSLSSQVHWLQMVQGFFSNLLKDSASSVDVKLSEITDTIGKNLCH